MPIKKPKKKVSYRDNQKTTHALELLNSRAVLALGNYLKYPIDDKAHESMKQLFKDYKKYKDDVHAALIGAFKFLTKERFTVDDDGTVDVDEPPSKQIVKEAKKHINQIARKVWKK